MHGCCFPWEFCKDSQQELGFSGEPHWSIYPWDGSTIPHSFPLNLSKSQSTSPHVSNKFPHGKFLWRNLVRPKSLDVFSDWMVETYPPPWLQPYRWPLMLSLERWSQEVRKVLYLPVDSWVRIPVALVPASLRPRGGSFLIFLEANPNQLISIKICIDFRACRHADFM